MAASAGAIRAGSAFVEIFARDGQFQQAMTRVRTRITQLGTIMRQAGTGMTLGGAAIAAPMVLALRQASGFQDALNEARTAAALTAAEVDKIKQKATELSAAGVGSQSGIAQAMTQLVKAGMPLEEVLNGAGEAVVKFAKNTGVETTRAAEIVQGSMTLFGVSAEKATDILKAAADASNTDVPHIVQGFSQVAKVAESAGQDMDTTASALAILSNNMTDGSDAGTSLKTMLQRLRTGAGEAEDGFNQLGLSVSSFRDATGRSLPIGQQMDILKSKLDGVDAVAKDQILFKIFGSDAIRAAEIFLDTGSAGFAKMQEAMSKSMTNADAFDIKMSGISGTFERISNAAERVSNAFADALGTETLAAFEQEIVGVAGTVGKLITAFPELSRAAAMLAGGLLVAGGAAIVGGMAFQGLGFAMRTLQGILPVIPALFTPVGLAIAGVTAGIAGGVMVARTLSPAFKAETDAIGAALARLDFGAAWELMRVDLAMALNSMSQTAAQSFDFLKNTAAAAGSFVADKLIEGFDKFLSVFGIDMLRLQEGFQKLGIFIRWAFDWSFPISKMQDAIRKVEAEIDRARAEGPTASARAKRRDEQRVAAAKQRDEAGNARDAGFDAVREELMKDHERALKRALGQTDVSKPTIGTQETKKLIDEMMKTMRVPMQGFPAAASERAGKKQLDVQAVDAVANKEKGISSAGNFSGVGLNIGPELSRMEDPAKRTADATEQTAEAVRQLVAKGGVVSDLHDNQRSELVNRAASLKKDIVGLAMNSGDEAEAQLQAKVAELKDVQNDLTALDAFRGFKSADPQAIAAASADSNMSAADLLEKIALGEFSNSRMTPQLAAPPAVAMETVAPRAPDIQANVTQGTATAVEASKTGVDFRQIGSEIVAAVNAGTEVSKLMLNVLTRIADKKTPGLAFQ
jgi:TP901 family phage tail tape measure protein